MRLFYDCRIKASYMAKEFGVTFRTKNGRDLVWDFDRFRFSDTRIAFTGDVFIVRSVSHALFEPQFGDIVEYAFIEQGGGHIEYLQYNDMWLEFGLYPIYIRGIAKRNGKAFIAPEVEG